MNKPNAQERRKLRRKNLSYYLPMIDNSTQQIIGHLVDISSSGLMIDTTKPIPSGIAYNLRLDLMEGVDNKTYVAFIARCKWCRPDSIQPYLYNAGFEIVTISPNDAETIKHIAEKYGALDSSFYFR